MRDQSGYASDTAQIMDQTGIGELLNERSKFASAKFQILRRGLKQSQLTPTAFRLLSFFVTDTWPSRGFCAAKVSRIAGSLQVTEQAVRKACRQLEACNLVYIDRQSGPNQENRFFLNFTGIGRNDGRQDETYVSSSLIGEYVNSADKLRTINSTVDFPVCRWKQA